MRRRFPIRRSTPCTLRRAIIRPGKKGDVLTVEFTVMGIPCIGLNGGPGVKHSWAFSFQVATADQAETDRYWNAIVGNGGQESMCGWCTDKWGLSWQITPIALTKAITDPDPAVGQARVRGDDDDEEDRCRGDRGGAARVSRVEDREAFNVGSQIWRRSDFSIVRGHRPNVGCCRPNYNSVDGRGAGTNITPPSGWVGPAYRLARLNGSQDLGPSYFRPLRGGGGFTPQQAIGRRGAPFFQIGGRLVMICDGNRGYRIIRHPLDSMVLEQINMTQRSTYGLGNARSPFPIKSAASQFSLRQSSALWRQLLRQSLSTTAPRP